MNIYERIRKLRIDAGMSQDDLARAMGYKDRSMITKIESGKVDISQKKIIAFARVLNTTPGYLMGWTDDYPDDPLNEKPLSSDARILAQGFDKLPRDQQERALAMFRVMFEPQYAHLFTKGNNDDDDA